MSLNESNLTKFTSARLFIFFISVYLLTASVVNSYHIDAAELLIQAARSLIERFDLSLPEGVGMRGADGRYYSWLGIGFALLAVPFYTIGELVGSPEIAVSIMNQIFGASTVVLIFLFSISLGYSRRASILVSVLYGLATIAWPLSKQPFDHVMETFFVLLSVYFMHWYILNKKVLLLLLSGVSLGVAFITRITSILVIPPLLIMVTVYYVKRHDFKTTARLITRDILLFSLAFLPFVVLNLWYNHYRFGSFFETGYSYIAMRMGIDFFTGTSLLTGLGGFLISPGKGFFFYSPVAVLFFFGIKSFLKRHLELSLCFICTMLTYLFFLSKNIYWHGDWAWGPRYLLVITPVLIIPIAELFDSDAWLKNSAVRAIVCSIFVVSVIIQLAAISVDFNKYFLNLRIDKKVEFTIAHSDGVQPIIEPPIETYFDWQRSPIFAQFVFIRDIAEGMKHYKYSKHPDNAMNNEKFRVDPVLNVFDFWWLYKYFGENSYAGFAVAFTLLLIAILCASRLWKLAHTNTRIEDKIEIA